MDSNKKKGKAIMKEDEKDQSKEVQDNNDEIKNVVNPWACSDCGKVLWYVGFSRAYIKIPLTKSKKNK